MKNYLLISLAIHVSVLTIVATLNYNLWPHLQYYPSNKIESYLIEPNFQRFHSLPLKTSRPKLNCIHSNSHAFSPLQKKTSYQTTKNQFLPQLTALLHNLIQTQIKHPPAFSPIFNNRKVTLSFMLFPDGHIEEVEIIQSSGVTLLDNEALEGVASLPKITIAETQLQKPEKFKIQVGFM